MGAVLHACCCCCLLPVENGWWQGQHPSQLRVAMLGVCVPAVQADPLQGCMCCKCTAQQLAVVSSSLLASCVSRMPLHPFVFHGAVPLWQACDQEHVTRSNWVFFQISCHTVCLLLLLPFCRHVQHHGTVGLSR
jgi:hypothetical protein